jgi:hypothetical protein
MTRFDWRPLALQMRIALSRASGLSVLLAVLLLALGIGSWLALAHGAQDTADELRQTLAQRQARLRGLMPAVPAAPVAQHPLAAFYAVLGQPAASERYVAVLFNVARRHGINLAQAEYQWEADSAAQTGRYRIRLPIKAPYGAIRDFCQGVLVELPFASLDELALKREAVTDELLTATVQFTLHLSAGTAGAAAAEARP